MKNICKTYLTCKDSKDEKHETEQRCDVDEVWNARQQCLHNVLKRRNGI